MKADIYLRTSTLEQHPEKQKQECLELLKNKGYELGNIYLEKLSGYKQIQRPKYYEDPCNTSTSRQKIIFYKEKKIKITFRLLNKQEYFFSGKIIETEKIKKPIGFIPPYEESYFIIQLDNGDLLYEEFANVDNLSIHPASYQPIKYFNRENISEEIRQQVFERANNLCQIKGEGCTGKAEEVDHIMPISKGGSNDISNLQASCINCNRKKSNK